MTATRTHILWLEGVNFGATLYDTNDLSVVRGSSLALETLGAFALSTLESADVREIRTLQTGASQAVFSFLADDHQAAKAVQAMRERLSGGIWQHMSVTLACAETGEVAEARGKSQQFRQWTIPWGETDKALRPDQLDHRRGAIYEDKLKGWISENVHARLQYGRKMRRAFFTSRFSEDALKDIHLCDSFEDMVGDAPVSVPEAVQSKIAIVHLDGDGFGDLAKEMGRELFHQELSAALNRVLHALVDHALSSEREEAHTKQRLRVEPLVWGGDDITLVMPAWRVLDFFERFYDVAKSERLGDEPPKFTGGAIIANYKAPVRQLVQLATEAVDISKTQGVRNAYTIDIFESAAPPEDGLAQHRSRVFGKAGSAKLLAFPTQPASLLRDKLVQWQGNAGDSFPSLSKIHGILQSAYPHGLMSDAAQKMIEDEFCLYSARVLEARERGGDLIGETWDLPAAGGAERPPALNLALVAMLWDYVTGAGQ